MGTLKHKSKQTIKKKLLLESVLSEIESSREREGEREEECVCVTNQWEGNGEEGRTEEGDSERVEVREGGECVGSRGSLR